jgi:hypothetical protein
MLTQINFLQKYKIFIDQRKKPRENNRGKYPIERKKNINLTSKDRQGKKENE